MGSQLDTQTGSSTSRKIDPWTRAFSPETFLAFLGSPTILTPIPWPNRLISDTLKYKLRLMEISP